MGNAAQTLLSQGPTGADPGFDSKEVAVALETVAGTEAKFQAVQTRKKVRKHEHQCRKFGVKAMRAVCRGGRVEEQSFI